MRVLLIEDIAELVSLLQPICEEEKISLDLAHNEEEVNAKTLQHYSLIFIRGKFLEEPFLKTFRPQMNADAVLAAISDSSLSVADGERLKKSFKIAFLFETPLYPFEIRGILAFIRGKQMAFEEASPLGDLRHLYDETITQKLERLEKLIYKREERESLLKLQKEVETIAKTSHAHRYFIVSQVCLLMDVKIQKWLTTAGQLDQGRFKALDLFFSKIKSGFQLNGCGEGMELEIAESLSFEARSQEAIALIDFDSALGEDIQVMAKGCGIPLILISSQRLRTMEWKTPLIKVAVVFHHPQENVALLISRCADILKKFNAVRLGIVDFHGSVRERLETIKRGVDFFLEKSLPLMDFLKELNHERLFCGEAKEKHFSVVVLGENVEVLKSVEECLEEWGGVVSHFREGTLFFEKRDTGEPDLILLCEPLVDLQGGEFIQLIRTDFRFKNTPLLVLLKSEETLENSAIIRNEEHLFAPFTPSLLKMKLLHLLKKEEERVFWQNHDHLTEVYTREHFSNTCFMSQQMERGVVCLIQIEDFTEIERRFGLAEGNTLLFQMGHLITQFFYPNEWIVGKREGQFALVLPGWESTQVEALVKVFVQKAQKNLTIAQSKKFSGFQPSILYSFVSFPTEGATLDDLYLKAEQQFAESGSGEGKEAPPPEFLFVDPDQELLDLLSQMVQRRGFRASVASSGSKALEYLQNRPPSQMPSLIILERSLGDMDGIDILKNCKRKFIETPLSFCFLTMRSSEEDILNGLREGAVDYIAKPFHLEVLMEKLIKYVKR